MGDVEVWRELAYGVLCCGGGFVGGTVACRLWLRGAIRRANKAAPTKGVDK